jgi:hypothetical protein
MTAFIHKTGAAMTEGQMSPIEKKSALTEGDLPIEPPQPARKSTGLNQEEFVHQDWEDSLLKRIKHVHKMSVTAFLHKTVAAMTDGQMSSMAESSRSGEQTPPQQPREPTAQPASQFPARNKKMPEWQKAEATAQPRRKKEGPKRASLTGSGEANGRTAKRSQAQMARNSREGTGHQRKRCKRNGPRQHISSQPTQPSRERKEGPKRASLTGKGKGGGDSNAPAKSSRKQPAGSSRSGEQTPPQQPREPTAQPASQFPATNKKMPEHQKAAEERPATSSRAPSGTARGNAEAPDQ